MYFTNLIIKIFKILTKIFFDFIPLILFLIIFYTTDDFYNATKILIISTILLTLIILKKERRIPYLALFICFETTLFGFLTLFFKNTDFLKIRDTLYDVTMGSLILVTALIKKPIIKLLFKHMFDLDDETWIKLSYGWASIMLTFAVINEIVRRNLSDEAWVNYKFGAFIFVLFYGSFLFFIFRKKTKIKID